MKLEANGLSIAAASVAGFLYAICWGIVAFAPGPAMRLTTDMLHMDVADLRWRLDLESLLVGVVVWGLVCGVAAWLVARVYNLIQERHTSAESSRPG